MNRVEIETKRISLRLKVAIAASTLLRATAIPAGAQNPLMNCQDTTQQDPAKILRSGLWKQ